MKKLIIICLLLVLAGSNYAQTNNGQGVYLSYTDYKEGKLVIADKISLNHFFSKDYIDVRAGGKHIRYHKDSIFGYRDKNGNSYRFFKNSQDEYQILEAKDMVIYVQLCPQHTTKGVMAKCIPVYYFSKGGNSDIYALSLINLKRAYPDNMKFHHALDNEFGAGKELFDFDEAHKMFRINFLLDKSL